MRIEANNAVSRMSESGVAIGDRMLRPQEQDSDTTVAGFVLQQHLGSLLKFFTSPLPSLRLAVLLLLGTLLRQGMVRDPYSNK